MPRKGSGDEEFLTNATAKLMINEAITEHSTRSNITESKIAPDFTAEMQNIAVKMKA